MTLVCFQGKPFYVTLIQVYAPNTYTEEAEAEQFRPTRHSRTNTKKICPFYHACVLSCFSHVWLFATPWTVARQAPLSMARILEWVAIASSAGSSQTKDQSYVSCGSWISGVFFITEPPGKPPFSSQGIENAKVGSQEICGVTGKFGLEIQNEAVQRLTEFCHKNTLVRANTLYQQHERQLYIWTSPDGQYQNQIDSILCSWRWRSSIQSTKTRPGADHGSDHELFIAKFRLKLKKAGNTTRPFRYELNQIPYDYTMEVMNRFKGLDLVCKVPEELWTEVHNIRSW